MYMYIVCFLDWEEMIDEPRLDLYPLDYDDGNHTGMFYYYYNIFYNTAADGRIHRFL